METSFDAAISVCRQTYGEYQQLVGRTDDALYQALSEVHGVSFRKRNDPVLRACASRRISVTAQCFQSETNDQPGEL